MLLALLFALSASAAPLPLKAALCPFNAAALRKIADHELLEHGGLEEIRGALAEQVKQYGPCRALRPAGEAFELVYKDAVVPVEVTLAGDRVRNLFIGLPSLSNDSFAKLTAFVKKHPYRTSFYLDDKPSFEPDLPLSISRSNQLFLLRAAKESGRKLSTTIPLVETAYIRAFGILHFWKPGTLLTVDTLLQLVVSEKDLTASDLLLSWLGRDAVARYGKSLAPFPSFREYFLLSRLPAAKLKDREAVATLLPAATGNPTDFVTDRPDLVRTLGWFASTRELCETALAVKEEILERNVRLNQEYRAVQPKAVEAFGLVLARDEGIAQTTEVFRVGGKWRCLSVTVNHDGQIEESYVASLLGRLVGLSLK